VIKIAEIWKTLCRDVFADRLKNDTHYTLYISNMAVITMLLVQNDFITVTPCTDTKISYCKLIN